MSAQRILIVYGTSYGQTAKIARRMADQLTASGDAVTLADADALSFDLDLADFGGVIVGASVIAGRHQRCVRRFVRAHRDALNAMPSAFFSVSGSAGSPDAAARAEARRCLDEFLRETDWRPWLAETVAGAMAYTRYSPLVRWMVRRITAKAGGPTDTSRDHEFTDWAQVQRFVEAFVESVPHPEDARALVTA